MIEINNLPVRADTGGRKPLNGWPLKGTTRPLTKPSPPFGMNRNGNGNQRFEVYPFYAK